MQSDGEAPPPDFLVRSLAPLHFANRAKNSRFSAYLMSLEVDENIKKASAEIGYDGTPSIAMHECYCREASLALELIVKAVIAWKVEHEPTFKGSTKVPTHHKISDLWRIACLPALSKDQMGVLIMAETNMTWAGRYATPTSYEKLKDSMQKIDRYSSKERIGNLTVKKGISFDFQSFDEVYQIARLEFFGLYSSAAPVSP